MSAGQSASGTPMPASSYAPDDEIDLGELFDLLLEGKWIVIGLTAVAAIFGAAFAILSTPIYQADALVQLETESSSMTALFGEMGDMLGATSESTAEIELIKSRLVLSRTIQQMGLNVQVEPLYAPVVGRGLARLADDGNFFARVLSLLPARYARSDDTLRVTRFDLPDDLLNESFDIVMLDDAGQFQLVHEDEGVVLAGVIGEPARNEARDVTLTIQKGDELPKEGRWFRAVRKDALTAVQDLLGRLSVSEKGKDSGILRLTLDAESPLEARDVLNAIGNNYLRQNVERKGEEADQTLQYLRKELPALRAKLEVAEVQFNAFRTREGSADLLQETELVLRQSAELEAARLKLSQEREQLLQRFRPGHPAIQAVDAQMRELDVERAEVEKSIRRLPETQQELLRLTRDVQVNTELYTALLNSAQQLEVAKAGTIGTVRIVDYAERPREPVKPKKGLIVAVALVLGGFLGVATVFLRRALYHTINDPQQFEQEFGLPVYANIPVSQTQKKFFKSRTQTGEGLRTLMAGATGDDIALEAIKSLRTALHFGMHDAANNVLLISGPRPGLGKSFVSANLAAAFAQAGSKTIVIDADMRRGTLHEYMGQERGRGLSDVLTGAVTVDDVVVQTRQDNLHALMTGTIPPNPSELLGSPRMVELLKNLSEQYEHVIIDTPPNLAVTDSGVLTSLAGTTVLVLRADMHPPREVAESIKRVRMMGGNLRGVVFNMVRQHARRYGYGRYNYYYAYGNAKK